MPPSAYQDPIGFLGERFETIDRRFDESRAEMLGHFDALYRRFDRLEEEYVAITKRCAGSTPPRLMTALGVSAWSRISPRGGKTWPCSGRASTRSRDGSRPREATLSLSPVCVATG